MTKTKTMRCRTPALVSSVFLVSVALTAVVLAWPGDGSSVADKENLDLPFEVAALSSEEEEEAPEIIIFYGQTFEGDAFFYCLDGSLSMANGEWEILQKELVRNIAEFSDEVEFGMVFFSESTFVVPADKKPMLATEQNKKAATTRVLASTPGSWTCMLEGLKQTIELANRARVEKPSIILMSDGKPTCPDTDFVQYTERILAEARALNTKKMPIHTIGIGFDINDHLLRTLARTSNGSYRRVVR